MSEAETPRTCQTCRHKWRKGTVHYDSVECYNCETVNGNPSWQKDTDTLERELAATTDRAELAERQVAVLCTRLGTLVDCVRCPAKKEGCLTTCDITTAAWARAEAMKG